MTVCVCVVLRAEGECHAAVSEWLCTDNLNAPGLGIRPNTHRNGMTKVGRALLTIPDGTNLPWFKDYLCLLYDWGFRSCLFLDIPVLISSDICTLPVDITSLQAIYF